MPEDPNTLFEEAKCFRCNSDASLSDLLKLALLQRIAESAGGGGGGTPGGAASSVQFNDAGAFGGFGSFNSGTSVLTIPGDLLFNTDDADDIGASGASRPRTGYFGTSVVTPLLTVLAAANANAIAVTGYSLTGANAQSMLSLAGTWNTSGTPTAIELNITNTASNGASLLMDLRTGGTSRFRVRHDGTVTLAAGIAVGVGNTFQFNGRSVIQSTADSILLISNNAQTDFNRINFGGSTALFPALKRSTTTLQVRLADDSAFANLSVLNVLSNLAATVITSSVALTDGAGAGAGTITNAPAAGNPTKWIGINDNGTIRYVPAW